MRAVAAEWSSTAGAPARPADEPRALATTVTIRELFDAHYDFIWRSVRRLGLSAVEADDAAQSVFIIASRKLAAIQLGKERSFLFGTAVRVVADVRKGAARRTEVAMDDHAFTATGPGADALVDEARARACLDLAVRSMSMELGTVFVLFELEELTMSQIAELLSIPAGTVASRVRRARAEFDARMVTLRKRFGGQR